MRKRAVKMSCFYIPAICLILFFVVRPFCETVYVSLCKWNGYSPEKIRQEIGKHKFLFPKIDYFVYIRVSPETCYMRKNDIPNMDYLNRRYAVYECLSEEDNWIIVNGETTFSEVNSRIKGIILRLTEHCY